MTIKEAALNSLMLNAAKDRAEAFTSLELLLNHGVGVGEHSTGDFHDNLNEALSKLADAEDRIECLKRNYGNFLPLQNDEN